MTDGDILPETVAGTAATANWSERYGERQKQVQVTEFRAGTATPAKVRIYRYRRHYVPQWWDRGGRQTLSNCGDGGLPVGQACRPDLRPRLRVTPRGPAGGPDRPPDGGRATGCLRRGGAAAVRGGAPPAAGVGAVLPVPGEPGRRRRRAEGPPSRLWRRSPGTDGRSGYRSCRRWRRCSWRGTARRGRERPRPLGAATADLEAELERVPGGRPKDRVRLRDGVLRETWSLTYGRVEEEFRRLAQRLGWPAIVKDLWHLAAMAFENAGTPCFSRRYLLGQAPAGGDRGLHLRQRAGAALRGGGGTGLAPVVAAAVLRGAELDLLVGGI